jgi:hypothetical protein
MNPHFSPSQADLRRAEAATWGAESDASPIRPKMRLISWKPLVKNSLRGFATIELPIGLKIIDCPVLVGSNGAWATLPSRPVLDRDGRQAKPDGKLQYSTILEWKSRDLSERFSQTIVELVRQAHPDDLDEPGAP